MVRGLSSNGSSQDRRYAKPSLNSGLCIRAVIIQVDPSGSNLFLDSDLPWPKAPEIIGTVFPGVS